MFSMQIFILYVVVFACFVFQRKYMFNVDVQVVNSFVNIKKIHDQRREKREKIKTMLVQNSYFSKIIKI